MYCRDAVTLSYGRYSAIRFDVQRAGDSIRRQHDMQYSVTQTTFFSRSLDFEENMPLALPLYSLYGSLPRVRSME